MQRIAVDLSIALKKTGEWEPSICCVGTGGGPFSTLLEKHGIKVYRCTLDRQSLVSFPFRFSKLLNQISPAIVHSHLDSSIPWQVLGCRLGWVKLIIFTQHNDGLRWNDRYIDTWRMRMYYRLCRPFISCFVTVSEASRTNFSRMLHCSADEFEVIYNPVNTNVFKPAPEARLRARKELGIGETKYVVGTVGRLIRRKGLFYLVEAAEKLVTTNPSFHFVLVGDGTARNRLEDLVRQKGLTESFTFTGRRSDVHAVYPAFDCLVSPSLSEGFGITAVEAMACGIPVVATNVGGVAEVIDYGRCGMLVPPADSKALYDAILEMSANPEKARMLVESGFRRVAECFSLQTWLERYRQVYQDVLKPACES